MRSVTINAALNGWVVNVGCQSLVYTDVTVLLGDLNRYMISPVETEKEILEKSINKHLLTDQYPEPAPYQDRPMANTTRPMEEPW